jgi:hypothetical protein
MSMLMFGFDIPYVALIASGSISWIPVVNPLLTMLLVPAYYRAALPRFIQNRVTNVSGVQPTNTN